MKTVRIRFNLLCKWETIPPVYRLYFNDELLTERNYLWENDAGRKEAVDEVIFVDVADGVHEIKIEKIGPTLGIFQIRNVRIDNCSNESLPDITIKHTII